MTEEIINKGELKNLRFLLQSGQKLAISTKEFERVFDKIDSLEQENTLLKEQLLKKSETEQAFQSLLDENKELKGRCQKLLEDLSCSNGCLRNKIDIEIIYRSALEEINTLAKNYCNACDEFKVKTYKNKNDCFYCNYGFIKRKINEVLNHSEG